MFDRAPDLALLDAGGIREEPVEVDFARQLKQPHHFLLECFSCKSRRPVFDSDDECQDARHASNLVRQVLEGKRGRAGRHFLPRGWGSDAQGRHDLVSVVKGSSLSSQ